MEQYNENERFISILSDYGFKVTFGNESDTRFLRKALQALVNSPVPIREVVFIQSEIKGITMESRGGIYDLACTDANNNHFIVEMQLSEYPEFIHRMKFYALHRFNTLVRKGKYTFENLPKIYCIGILAKNIFSEVADYHNIATLKNEKNELIDDQLTFITLELAKFKKNLNEINSDLDKLIYTMKNLHKAKTPKQYPQFWNEEWLDVAIKELETKKLTPEQRFAYEMTISKNAVILRSEEKKIKKAVDKAVEIAEEKARKSAFLALKTESVKKAIQRAKLTIQEIAEDNDVSVDFVLDIQNQLSESASS